MFTRSSRSSPPRISARRSPSTGTLSGPPSARFGLWVYADDCDAAVERLRTAGVEIVEEPADQPWGERVARVLDPDGNLVIVGQRVADD